MLNIFLIFLALFPAIKLTISGIETSIVVDLTILNDESSSLSCPKGYIQSSGCDDKCDLNYNIGGNHIYLCQKKIKFKDLSSNDNPISNIKINYNSKNCGHLKLIDSDLNKNSGGEYIYLCYGSDEEDSSPITDVFIYIKGVNEIPKGYKCEWNNLTQGTEKKQEIYVCYYKDEKIPKLIEYSNIVFETNQQSMTEIKDPYDIIYIDNDNSAGDLSQSVKRTLIKTTENTYSFNIKESFGFSATLSASFSIPLSYS